jgi:uncharacterized membrane protein
MPLLGVGVIGGLFFYGLITLLTVNPLAGITAIAIIATAIVTACNG